MKKPLLLFLLLPLHAFAQYRPSYSAPVRTFTPTPYQVQQRGQQQAYQTSQRMQAQQMQNMQQQMFRNQQQALTRQQQLVLRPQPTPQQLEEAQTLQDKAEQQANEQLAQLAAEQQRQRLAQPAADAQQATAQQQADARKLTALAVKNYREVFLPWQVSKALQARGLSAKAHEDLLTINKDLLHNAWWSKQELAPLNEKVAAYGKTLAALTADLLGFDLATPPAASTPGSVGLVEEMLAKDAFDQAVATQLIRETAQAEKVAAGDQLAKAVVEFNNLSSVASPAAQSDPKKRRDEVKAGLRKVNQELQRYYAQVGSSRKLYEVQKALLKSTAGYVAKNSK